MINIIITRKQRRRDGIKSYSDTIDMLLESNARLINEQVELRAQIVSLRAQLERCQINTPK